MGPHIRTQLKFKYPRGYLSNVVWRDFRPKVSTLATVAGKSFYCKFTEKKKRFSDRVFYIITAGANIGSLKSLHTLFDKCLDHMLVEFGSKSYDPN